MKIFETFNFDIIIILVFIASLVSGFYYSLYRQGKKTLILVLPFIVLYLILDDIVKLIYNIKILSLLIDKIFIWFKFLEPYKNYLTTFAIGLISFVILSLFIKFIYDMFKPSVQKRVLNKPSKYSRIVASVLGLCNGYIIAMILMFAVKPFIDIKYDRPLTAVINETNNEVISISVLNEIQNINVEKYITYEESLQLLNGRTVLNEYNNIQVFINDIPTINEDIKNNLIPILSQPSRDLIANNLIDNNYIDAFIKNSKTILSNEKNNDKFNLLEDLDSYLKEYEGYLYLNNLNQTATSFEDLMGLLEENQIEIKSKFTDFKSKINFEKLMEKFIFFKNHYQDFNDLIANQGIDLQNYVLSYEEIFKSPEKLNNFINSFQVVYSNSDNDIIKNILQGFKEYQKNVDSISLMNEEMSLSIKITLADSYSNWFVDASWEENILLKSYMVDALSYQNIRGNGIYHEYFFYNYLAYDLDFNKPFTEQDFTIILNRLEEVVENDLLSEKDANKYINNLFNNKHSVLYDLKNKNKISEDVFKNLKNNIKN